MERALAWILAAIFSVIAGIATLVGIFAIDSTLTKMYHRYKTQKKLSAQ